MELSKNQYRRLVVAVLLAVSLMIVAIALLILVINKPHDVQINNYVGKNGKDGQSITGIQGIPGVKGDSIVGASGKDGTNAQTIIVNTNTPVPGEPGQPSPQIKVQVTPITCLFQSKYEGDDLWTTLAQLPKPCEVVSE